MAWIKVAKARRGVTDQRPGRSMRSEPVEPFFNTAQLNLGGRDEATLQGMRPEALREEEMLILRARDAELPKEREELREEARIPRQMTAQQAEERANAEREDRRNRRIPEDSKMRSTRFQVRRKIQQEGCSMRRLRAREDTKGLLEEAKKM